MLRTSALKIIRALEIRLETGKPLTEHLKVEPRRPLQGFSIYTVGLNPPREECYRRIDARVERMFQAGLIEEVQGLMARGVPPDAKPLSVFLACACSFELRSGPMAGIATASSSPMIPMTTISSTSVKAR